MTTETLDESSRCLQLLMHKYMTYVNCFSKHPICMILQCTELDSSIVFDCMSDNNGNLVYFTIEFHIRVQPLPATGGDFHNIHHVGEGMVGTFGHIITQVYLLKVNSIGDPPWSKWVAYGKWAVIRALHEKLVERGFVTNPQGTDAALEVICS